MEKLNPETLSTKARKALLLACFGGVAIGVGGGCAPVTINFGTGERPGNEPTHAPTRLPRATFTTAPIISLPLAVRPVAAGCEIYRDQPIPHAVSPKPISQGLSEFGAVSAARVAYVLNGENPEYAADWCVQTKYKTARDHVANVLGVGNLAVNTDSFSQRLDAPGRLVVGGRSLPVVGGKSFEADGTVDGKKVKVRVYQVSPETSEFSRQIAVSDLNPKDVKISSQSLKPGEKLYVAEVRDALGNIRWTYLVRDLCVNETAVGEMVLLTPTPQTPNSPTPERQIPTSTSPAQSTATSTQSKQEITPPPQPTITPSVPTKIPPNTHAPIPTATMGVVPTVQATATSRPAR